ncbi:MAG: hypothetical protein ACLP9L_22200 [Thermoguttaceae bacterium]
MMPDYDPKFDWQTNIQDLASKLTAILAERAKTRETIHPYPNTTMPVLIQANLDAVATFDAETQLIQWQALAAKRGMLWWDPEATKIPVVTLNKKLQEWFRQGNKRGKLLYPQDMVESAHSFSHESPMMVRR